ncbi:DUF413 domain-containing protein [Motiliproteus sediminis]|uniref:DUF413 domain-containing protein n=1 Tax=Motiliproteus sediminis TaxID=1468178 RepID=UPI001AEF7466|nr:DUF413 domain-containing protein [Motiliproteus sediminis]
MATAQQQFSSFFSDRKFRDDDNFPYGFDRSGEFTPAQSAALVAHGWAMKQLATGERAPVTEEEHTFVAFCRGAHPAATVYEKAWERYTRVCQKDKHFYTVGDSRPATNSGDDFDDFDDD